MLAFKVVSFSLTLTNQVALDQNSSSPLASYNEDQHVTRHSHSCPFGNR